MSFVAVKSAWLPLCVFALCSPFSAPVQARQLAASARDEESSIKHVVDQYLQPFLAQDGAPGAIVGISLSSRRYFFKYGQATDDGAPFTPNTLVEIGSCTKVSTTTLFALAIGRNQIAPDDSAQKYMPAKHHLQPSAQGITPRQLADFTSGMPDDPPNLPRRLQMRNIENYTGEDFMRWVSGWQPASPPPAPYLYLNAGIGLLSYLVADATSKPWQEQLNDDILGPLGMSDTALRPSGEQMSRMAQGHRANGMDAPRWPIFAWFAAGGLRSTTQDMLRFGRRAHLGYENGATSSLHLAQR